MESIIHKYREVHELNAENSVHESGEQWYAANDWYSDVEPRNAKNTQRTIKCKNCQKVQKNEKPKVHITTSNENMQHTNTQHTLMD